MSMPLTLSQFDFALPPELIAQHAGAQRSASRLLAVGPGEPPALEDSVFSALPRFLRPGDLLVANDTRVIKARLFGQKASGGAVEVLIERVTGEREALAMVRASKTPQPGSRIRLADAFEVEVGGRDGQFFELRFPEPCLDLLERYGNLPLPPYITHAADAGDEARYQTVYARNPGAVAAPTAGLHFDDVLFAELDRAGVRRVYLTLHVGAGTFQPVRTENVDEHRMHAERYAISPQLAADIAATRAAGGRVVAVGSTTLRALEASACDHGGVVTSGEFETDIFITPGYRFQVIDMLITNFHLPKSTLLMLVSAFAGMQPIRAAYAHAISQRYRFFSYGDAMLLARAEAA
ncbi:MAG: tRNA preQ1(34) S-adenosylmethionine ribosyltransferase-isomerase QueA [Candidatus Protistobacter heckmanni]|nr:tRNA preQ1(34) S-adenosylmethionine ribosyltransferase-isomerase QueA [Candidatus Protistobacter heckmanni]